MNKNIIFAGAGGLIVGSIATLLITRRFYLKVIKDLCDVNDSLSEELREANEISHSVISNAESAAKASQVMADTTTNYDEVLSKIEKLASRPKPSLEELARQTQYEIEVDDMFYDPDDASEEDEEDEHFNLFEKYSDFVPESTSSGEKYLITEEEYGSLENYQFIELIQYADGLIADKHDNLLDDVDDTLGVDNVEQCEDMDIYWIRDDSRRIDYEIMRIEDRYAERMRVSPFRMSRDIYTKDL